MSQDFRDLHDLHGLLLDLVGAMNSPRSIAALLHEAGVALDRALFPLLLRIDRHGPIGVVDLAEMVGRDYTTVSRQVAQLEQLGLVSRRMGTQDRRVREAMITDEGRVPIQAIDAARERMFGSWLSEWRKKDRRKLLDLLARLTGETLDITRRNLASRIAGDSAA